MKTNCRPFDRRRTTANAINVFSLVVALMGLPATFVRAEGKPTMEEQVFAAGIDAVKKSLPFPDKAQFRRLGYNGENRAMPLGEHGVWVEGGFVDAPDARGVPARSPWEVRFLVNGGELKQLYLIVGGKETGDRIGSALMSRGLDPATGEKLGLSPEEVHAAHRTTYHEAARNHVRAFLPAGTLIQDSKLGGSDDEWTYCREIGTSKVWEAAGIIQYTGAGRPVRVAWQAYVLEHGGDPAKMLWQKVGTQIKGDLTEARRMAGIEEKPEPAGKPADG